MRRSAAVLTLLGCSLLGGCLTHRKPPYSNDPLLLHYKPTLSDSATILAEKQAKREPARPPMPPGAQHHSPSESAISLPVRAQKATTPETPSTASAPGKDELPLLPPPPAESAPLSMPAAAHLPLVQANAVAGSNLEVPPPARALPTPPQTIVRAEELAAALAKVEFVPHRESATPTFTVSRPGAAAAATKATKATKATEVISPPPATNEQALLPPAVGTPPSEPPAPIAVMVAEKPATTAEPPRTIVPSVEIKLVSTDLPSPAALPGKPRRSVDGDYGHDQDYRWIQGKLERHYRGYYCVRYRDPSEEDANGGKVRLQDDPRIASFNDGDVIAVEGGVEQAQGERGTFPRYIVRDAWLVRKK